MRHSQRWYWQVTVQVVDSDIRHASMDEMFEVKCITECVSIIGIYLYSNRQIDRQMDIVNILVCCFCNLAKKLT